MKGFEPLCLSAADFKSAVSAISPHSHVTGILLLSNYNKVIMVYDKLPSTGIEPVTYGLEVRCSIRLSYEGKLIFYTNLGHILPTFICATNRCFRYALLLSAFEIPTLCATYFTILSQPIQSHTAHTLPSYWICVGKIDFY